MPLSPGVIAQACNPNSEVLMSWAIYAWILRAVGASPPQSGGSEICTTSRAGAASTRVTGLDVVPVRMTR